VSSPGADIIVGQTASLTATPKDAKGNTLTNRTVAWTSSSQAIATVGSTGVVTGVAPGSATITATVEGKTGTAAVTVVVPPVATVTVTAVSTTLQAGQTTQASAVTRDASNTVVTGRAVAWSTSNAAVATVSVTGVVTALTPGVATITATSEGKSGTVQITVIAGNPADAPQITSVTPSPLVEGQAATITGTKFGSTANANIVRIGGVFASVTAASATSLQIIVPDLNCAPAQNVSVDVTVAGNVSAPRSQAFTPGGAPFTLAQGRQVLLGVPANFCLQFPASNASETYLIGVQSVSEVVTNVTPVTVAAQAPTGAAEAAPMSIAPGPSFSASLFTPRSDVRSERMARHRTVEASLIDQDRALFASRFRNVKGAARPARASLSQVPTVPSTVKVGDVLNIRVPNRNQNTCQNFIPVAVTVKVVGAKGIFVEDNGNPTGGFATSDYQALSDRFDSQIYATDAGYFGVPTDQDKNGRVVIVITKEVNKIANLLGEVFTADLVTQQECPASNEGEFFYGRAPDPTGTAGAAYTVADALLDAPIIVAHEFTHVIQLGRRLNYEPATAFQSTWELEGQATFAEEVNGYTATGLAPGQNLGFEIAFNNPPAQPISWFIDPFVDLVVYYGFISQTSRAIGAPEQCSWLATRSQGNTGPCLTGREPYGVPWSFLRWLSDQYGGQFPGGEKGFHQQLVDNAFTGYATIQSVIGQPIDVLLAQWAATLYTDDRVPNIDPKLTLKSWNLFAIENRLVANAKLTPYDRPFGSFTDQIAVRAGSTAYFRVSGSGRSATGIRIRDNSDLPLPDNMRVWVVRIQ
jgi:hypothetical protein